MVSNLAYKQKLPEIQYVDLPQDDDIKWCTVSLSDVIKTGKRLEASVFEVDGKHARNCVENGIYPSVPLYGENALTTAYTCGRFKRVWLPFSEFPIYQPSSIMDIKPQPDGYLSPITHANIEALRVKKGQILISCSGTIGKVSLVSKTLDNQIFSHDLIRMSVLDDRYIGYVYAFLRSNIGNTLLQSNKYGAVITHIEPEHLTDIPIPNPPDAIKAKINYLIVNSFELRDRSNELIDQATALLIEELQFPPIHEFETGCFDASGNVNNFTVKLSEIAGRLDGSYHVPIVAAITKHLQTHAAEVTTVGDKRVSKDVVLPGRFKRYYVTEGQGRVFFGGKQLYELDPSNKKYLSLAQHGDRIKKQLELNENMTLITCSGTIGKVTLVPKHWEHWTANQHIIRVVPANQNIAGYLSVFLASAYGYPLITRHTYGSVVDEIDDKHVSKIPIPLLKNQVIQAEINALALQANRLRYEAYQAEQEALRIMNDEVIFA